MNNKVISVIKKYLNTIINSELYIILIGIILFFKMCFFYNNTIYQAEPIKIELIAKTFIFSMFIVTFLFVLKNRSRFILANILNLFLSILMFADNLYYGYSTSLISVAQISNLQYSEQITASIGELFKFSQLLYFIDIVILIVLLLARFIKIEKIKIRRWKPAILYTAIMLTVYGSTISGYVTEAQTCRYNKKMQLEIGTLYTFHYLDVQSNMNLKKSAKYKTKSEVMDAYNKLKDDYDARYNNDSYALNGIAEGKNVILLQLESIQNFVVNKSINGKEITPNLNRFLKENIQIDDMIIQSYSTTADSEHTVMSSMYPLENGMAFAQYSSNKYNDIFEIYKNADYHTVYMHGNDGSFWNRKNVYRLLDVDDINFIDSFDPESELINGWISDEELYRQAVQRFSKCEEPFFASVVSASSHTAFDLPGIEDKDSKVSIDVGKYKDTYFGNYLESANYADYAFGIFIEKLKEVGLYDNTVIFLFGDHYGLQMYNEEMLEFIRDTDHEYNNIETEINYANVVCGMYIPGIEDIEITKAVSKLDIKPTLAYISGVEDEVSLGTNIFGNKDFACINNGIIVSNDYYYNGKWYDIFNGEEIIIEELDNEKKELLQYYENSMNEELTISNSIVLNNLLR